jgi:hypothetical protein
MSLRERCLMRVEEEERAWRREESKALIGGGVEGEGLKPSWGLVFIEREWRVGWERMASMNEGGRERRSLLVMLISSR